MEAARRAFKANSVSTCPGLLQCSGHGLCESDDASYRYVQSRIVLYLSCHFIINHTNDSGAFDMIHSYPLAAVPARRAGRAATVQRGSAHRVCHGRHTPLRTTRLMINIAYAPTWAFATRSRAHVSARQHSTGRPVSTWHAVGAGRIHAVVMVAVCL